MNETIEDRIETLRNSLSEKLIGIRKLYERGGHDDWYADFLLNKEAEYKYFLKSLDNILVPGTHRLLWP